MTAFLARRFIGMLISIWLVVTVVFFLARITGDPVNLLIGDTATDEEIRLFREQHGLDDPLPLQYVRFVEDVLRGDFGMSIRHSEPAFPSVLSYMPATIELATASLAISVIFGISLGVLAALRPGSIFELLTMVTALIGQAVPVFPGIAITLVVLGANLLGDWLNVVLDPRRRGRESA